MLNIIVCMKQVIDPEAPASLFQIDAEAKRAIPPKGTPPVLNPFDENALEIALRIKDAQEAEVTVLSLGRSLAKPVVKKSLAAGADELILLEDEAFGDFDSYTTAYLLTQAIHKVGRYDLILCGREAADTDAAQVGPGVAGILGIPYITVARKVEVSSGGVRVERVLSDGYEVVETAMPVLVTASNEGGELRYPTIKDVMAAQKKDVTVWSAADLGVDVTALGKTRIVRLFQPVHEGECEIIAADSPEEAAVNLAVKLRSSKII